MLIVYPDYYRQFSCIAGDCEDETDEVLACAQTAAARQRAIRRLQHRQKEIDRNYALAKRSFYRLCDLERLRDDWDQLLIETQMLLYVQGAKGYARVHEEFAQWWKTQYPMLAQERAQP